MGESNEMIVSLEQSRDLYSIDSNLIEGLVDTYDKIGRQLYKLAQSWTNFKKSK